VNREVHTSVNTVPDLYGIDFKLGEVADLLLVLSQLGYGNEVPGAAGSDIGGDTLGGCFSVIWSMVDGIRKDIDALESDMLQRKKEESK